MFLAEIYKLLEQALHHKFSPFERKTIIPRVKYFSFFIIFHDNLALLVERHYRSVFAE